MPRQQTIRINQGYRIDSKWEAARAHRPRVAPRRGRLGGGTGPSWASCLALLLVRLVAGRYLCPRYVAWMTLAATAATVLLWPASRALSAAGWAARGPVAGCWPACGETRVATSAGRLPLVLRSRATPAGERLIFGLFPGQSAELLDARVEELRAAARARDVTVTRDPGRADRVMVDVIRRDPLRRPGPALTAAGLRRCAVTTPGPP